MKFQFGDPSHPNFENGVPFLPGLPTFGTYPEYNLDGMPIGTHLLEAIVVVLVNMELLRRYYGKKVEDDDGLDSYRSKAVVLAFGLVVSHTMDSILHLVTGESDYVHNVGLPVHYVVFGYVFGSGILWSRHPKELDWLHVVATLMSVPLNAIFHIDPLLKIPTQQFLLLLLWEFAVAMAVRTYYSFYGVSSSTTKKKR